MKMGSSGIVCLCTPEPCMCFFAPEEFAKTEPIVASLEKHTKEIKRVKTYIRSKKQKNEFEIKNHVHSTPSKGGGEKKKY